MRKMTKKVKNQRLFSFCWIYLRMLAWWWRCSCVYRSWYDIDVHVALHMYCRSLVIGWPASRLYLHTTMPNVCNVRCNYCCLLSEARTYACWCWFAYCTIGRWLWLSCISLLWKCCSKILIIQWGIKSVRKFVRRCGLYEREAGLSQFTCNNINIVHLFSCHLL